MNLAPADVKKEGPSFDLPIALAMIACAQDVKLEHAEFFARHRDYEVDFADVRGQRHVKRAIEIAACGGHGLLIVRSN